MVVDGVLMDGFAILREIPANQVASIQILNGISGAATYGTGSTGGVIYIRTKSGGPVRASQARVP